MLTATFAPVRPTLRLSKAVSTSMARRLKKLAEILFDKESVDNERLIILKA
jgi:hypothetical protein